MPPFSSIFLFLSALLQLGYWFRDLYSGLGEAYERFTAVWLLAE